MNAITSTRKKPGRNIYMVGFMGTGKTVIGRKLADSLGYSFIDSDAWIEEREGVSIPTLFETKGEAYFRELEREFIEKGHPERGMVVSCGGGLIVPVGMIEKIEQKGSLFCLFATAETILERTGKNNNRPLLAGEDRAERVRKLLAEREPIYQKAGTLITTDQRSISEIVKHIKRVYRQQNSR